MKPNVRRGLVVALTASLTLIPGIAQASCAESIPVPEAIANAKAVFVGTVTDTEHQDRLATFEVDQIWKGDVDRIVLVNGGPALSDLEEAKALGHQVHTSADRSYQVGNRYLVVAHGSEGRVLLDNQCSVTQVYNSDLDQYRPDSAITVSPPLDDTVFDQPETGVFETAAVIGLVVTAMTAAAAIGLITYRRSRRGGHQGVQPTSS